MASTLEDVYKRQLITFLHMDPYMAVGIALSSDVLASAVSAYTYHKNKNLDIKNGLIMICLLYTSMLVASTILMMPVGFSPMMNCRVTISSLV